MATITFEGYFGAGPAWTDIGANTLVFSGDSADLSVPVTVAAWQDGTHIGSGTPGTDQCGANHNPNVKYIAASQFDNGGGTEALNDTNLTANECSLRLHFNHTSSVDVTGARLYCDDGAVAANESVGVDVYAFEQGQGNTAWVLINDDTGNIGGDNTGERLDLTDSAAPATDHYWYVALSVSPESVGGKSSFRFGFALTYS